MTVSPETPAHLDVEACVEAGDAERLERSLVAARNGGAARVELCRDLAADGLTPRPGDVTRAREVLGDPVGNPVELLALIRCRGGGFEFSAEDLARMDVELGASLDAGADGVVIGALRDGAIDRGAVTTWVAAARARGARVGFHRAFDALTDPLAGLETLIELGVDRVLCSGTAWGTAGPAPGGATAGAERLAALVAAARGRIELVLAAGITPENAPALLQRVAVPGARLSLHAAGGVSRDGVVDAERVAQLVAATRAARRAPSPPDTRS